jgi:hypothetical protein
MYIIILNFDNNQIECIDITNKPKKMDTEQYAEETLKINLSNCQFMEVKEKPEIKFLGEKYARKCDKCGAGMDAGYYADGEYYCQDNCLHSKYTPTEWKELNDMHENTDFYWTDWEDTEDYQYQIINGVLQEIE